ncbi:hypothetical protein [Amycolatopsis sp. NPDC058986]|uniref:hypothetical protein n=1 Tax=unclassified Amycolatopsis TaxID=2618356 RepID=UPI00366FA31B
MAYPYPPPPAVVPQQPLKTGVTATVTAVLGLALGGAVFSKPIVALITLPKGTSVGDLSGGSIAALGLFLLFGIILLVGGILVFTRAAGGLVTLIVGTTLTIALGWLEPLFYDVRYGRFLKASFEFKIATAYGTVACVTLAPVVLVLAVVALVLRPIRRKRAAVAAVGGPPLATPTRPELPAVRLLRLGMAGVFALLAVVAIVLSLVSRRTWRHAGVFWLIVELLAWAVVLAGAACLFAGKKAASLLTLGGAVLALVGAVVEVSYGSSAWVLLVLALVACAAGAALLSPYIGMLIGVAAPALPGGHTPPQPPHQQYPPSQPPGRW